MDITPQIRYDSCAIVSYDAQGFRLRDGRAQEAATQQHDQQSLTYHKGAIMIKESAFQPWDIAAPLKSGQFDIDALLEQQAFFQGCEILLLGTGAKGLFVKPKERLKLKAYGLVLDVMSSAAAARSYAVLLSEQRKVAAFLLPSGFCAPLPDA